MEMPSGPPVAGQSPPSAPVGVPAPESPESPAPPPGLLEDEVRNRRLVATVAAVALVLVAAMIASFLVTRDRGDGDGEVAEPAPPVTDLTATSVPEPLDSVDSAELEALVTELEAFVEEERGISFTEEVSLEVLDDEAYTDRVQADVARDLDESRDDLTNGAATAQALGLWPAGLDPVEVVSEFSAVASGGFYDPETGGMVVRGGAVTPLLRSTLVHELTHALDDQHLDLDRPELDDLPDESGFAFSALTEGSAERVEEAYRATMSDEDLRAAEAEEAEIGAGIDVDAFPPILLLEQRFVYVDGAAFVDALHADGGNRRINQAFRRPPTTSEQILEPEAWLDGEVPAPVAAPEADGDVLEERVVGQFTLHLLTGLAEPQGTVQPEWAGDNSVLWADGDRFCLRAAVDGDVDGFEEGLAPWADSVGGELTVEGDQLILTACN